MSPKLLRIGYLIHEIAELYPRRNEIVSSPRHLLGLPVDCLIDILRWELEGLR